MSCTVLVVDDHAEFRSVVRALLQAEGFDVVGEAADGISPTGPPRCRPVDHSALPWEPLHSMAWVACGGSPWMTSPQELNGLIRRLDHSNRYVLTDDFNRQTQVGPIDSVLGRSGCRGAAADVWFLATATVGRTIHRVVRMRLARGTSEVKDVNRPTARSTPASGTCRGTRQGGREGDP